MNEGLGWIIALFTGFLCGGCIGYWVGRIDEVRNKKVNKDE